MNVVFMGTPDFAVESLKALYNGGHCIKGVFTQPDKPRGRKKKLTPPDVKVWAMEHNIPVYQPESVRHGEADPILKELNPDVIVVAAYGNILPSSVLEYPKYGCINVHGSILPEYRGAAPIQWAVLDGKEKTGITTMQMDVGLDTGDILMVKETEIGENETSGELFDRLAVLGGETLLETLLKIETIKPIKQDNSKSSYASMLSKDNSPIDWNKTAVEIHNQVRGLNPWPTATAVFNGKPLKIHETEKVEKPLFVKNTGKPGKLYATKNELFVECGDCKFLKINCLQPHGSKRMDAPSFLNGHPIDEETILK